MEKRVHPPAEPESLDQLRGDCALMAPHWGVTASGAAGPREPGGSPERLQGVRVPPRSARLLDGMSEYGD